jgi:hypothetical protein
MNSIRLIASLLALAAAFAPMTVLASSYALCIRETPARIAARTDPQAGPTYWAEFAAFGDQLKAAGILRSGSAFDTRAPSKTVKPGQPSGATALARPGADTFGGYFVIEVNSEAESLAWAARVPNTGGSVDVHLLLPMMAK